MVNYMTDKIKNYIINNGYNGKGLCQYLSDTGSDRRYKAHWCAATTSTRSGIIKYKGVKYYFNCIAPWAMCPNGRVEVEIMAR